MNLSPVDEALFFQTCRFRRRKIDSQAFWDQLGAIGLVYYHALVAVKRFDPFAVEARETNSTSPTLLIDFLKHFGAFNEDSDRAFFNLRPDLLSINYVNTQIRFHEMKILIR